MTVSRTRQNQIWTVLKVIRWTTDYLTSKGVDTARLDAEVLLADLLNMSRVDLYLNYDRPLTPDELAGFRARVQKRACREPVAYIICRKEFFSLDFTVNPHVLIPRPETEILVEEALRQAKLRWPDLDSLNLLDLGTGSGAIAVALAATLKDRARVWASDIHGPALEVAAGNAHRHGVGDRITFLQGDLFEALTGREPHFHLITANLPYVPLSAFDDMEPEVKNHEPRWSLSGGPDGLDLIRGGLDGAREYLAPGGVALFEIWPTMGQEVFRIGRAGGLTPVSVVPDLAGRDRIAVLELEGA